MRSKLLRSVGFHSALLVLLMLILSPFTTSARPQISRGDAEKPAACSSLDDLDPAVWAPMQEFWQRAWGHELVLGQMGMVLQETGISGYWDVLVNSKSAERWIDRGTFIEDIRHDFNLGTEAVDGLFLKVANGTRIDHFVVAGTVIGSAGESMSVAAMVTELEDESGNTIRSFSVADVGVDPEAASSFAEGLAYRLNRDDANERRDEGFNFEKSGSGCIGCEEEKEADLDDCSDDRAWCLSIATGQFALCVRNCSALLGTPLFPPCFAVCATLFAGRSLECAQEHAECVSNAEERYDECLENTCDY